MSSKLRVVVLISGSGSNLQAIIDATERGDIHATIVGVISNKENVKGLERAKKHHIPTYTIDHKAFASREAFDQELRASIDAMNAELVVLAGFMRILTPAFVEHFLGRMINIHPSLLPKYQGLHTHRRALEAGDKEHGVTVHFVTADLDGGPAIIQAIIPLLENDTEDTVAARVLKEEHYIYPKAIEWFAKEKIKMQNGLAFFDNVALPNCGVQINRYADGAVN